MKNKIRAILLTSLSFIGIVVSLILYFMSYKKEDYGEWGIDYTFNYNYFVMFIIFVVIFILGMYELISILKNKEYKDYSFIVVSIVLAIGASYPYSVFFKALTKSSFDYLEYQYYLYIGTVSLVGLIGCIIYYFKNKNK